MATIFCSHLFRYGGFPGYPGFPGFPGYFPWWPPSLGTLGARGVGGQNEEIQIYVTRVRISDISGEWDYTMIIHD